MTGNDEHTVHGHWTMRGDVAVVRREDGSLLGVLETGSVELGPETPETVADLSALRHGGVKCNLGPAAMQGAISILAEANLLHQFPPAGLSSLAAMNWTWGECVAPGAGLAQSLSKKSAVIIGCGGTGCLVAQALAASGIGRLVLIDNDIVSKANLNRQFVYQAMDVGRSKADALSQRLTENQELADAVPVRCFVASPEDLLPHVQDSNLIVCCADEPAASIQSIVAQVAIATGTATLFGSVGIWNGTVGPLLTGRDAARRFLRWASSAERICERVIVRPHLPSNGITNAIVSQFIAWEALRHLANFGPSAVIDRALNFDFQTLSMKPLWVYA